MHLVKCNEGEATNLALHLLDGLSRKEERE